MTKRVTQSLFILVALSTHLTCVHAQDSGLKKTSETAPASASTQPTSAPSQSAPHKPVSDTHKQIATDPDSFEPFILSEDEWKRRLSPKEFYILREKGTERAHSGSLLHNTRVGTYRCAGCNAPLFSSKTKFKSGTGWPSFYRSLRKRVRRIVDRTHGMTRTEIVCARCNGHLGHVFRDGPRPTGLRHCVNSLALRFEGAPSQETARPASP